MRLIRAILVLLIAAAMPNVAAAQPPKHQPAYRNFKAAIYITVGDTKRLADPATFERDFARVSSQLKFDKVYVEGYRDRQFASDAQLEAVKRAFAAKGIETAGGITLAAGGSGGQFGTFDYEIPADRAEAERAVENHCPPLRRGDPRRLLLLHIEERRRHRRQGQPQLDPVPARHHARRGARPGDRPGHGRRIRGSS